MDDLRTALMNHHFSICCAEGRVVQNNGSTYALDTFPIGDSYDSFQDIIPSGMRITNASEELCIQYFMPESSRRGEIVVSSDGVRVPIGWGDRVEIDCKGGKRIPRILLKNGEPDRDVFIPHSLGRMYVPANGNFYDMFDSETGFPFEITTDEKRPHSIHFRYDPRTRHDTALAFVKYGCMPNDVLCTTLDASYSRTAVSQDNRLRLVEEKRKWF